MGIRYLVVCQARTGSTMLSSALQQHPEICAHGEVLNFRTDDRLEFFGLDYGNPGAIMDFLRKELWRAPDEFIDRYVFHAGRFKAAGFKFKYEELSSPFFESARNYVRRNRDIRIIHMTRKDIWKRFLSEYVALNVTKVFNSSGTAIQVPDVTFRLEPQDVLAAFEKTENWQREYRRFFSQHSNMMISYEDFNADPSAAFHKVTEFLDVSEFEFRPQTKKIQKQRGPKEMIENFDELQSHFAGTAYGKYFR